MISFINVVTLPRTCFAVVLDDYQCHNEELVISKMVYKTKEYPSIPGQIINEPTESIVKDKTKTLYVNLDVRKYLLTDAKLLSGKVQALSCDYMIHTGQDSDYYAIQKVKDVLSYNFHDQYFENTVELLNNALDFDLISEDDYVKMTYNHTRRLNWKQSRGQWDVSSNHDINKVIQLNGMFVPANKKVLELQEVLPYSNNRGITPEEANKIKTLLASKDSEKIALTLLNTVNPEKSFVEIICLINHMDENIRRNNPNVPVLPLIKGAYSLDTAVKRRSDKIVEDFERQFGHASNDILERIADNYYHPKLEKSSVFDFKLKIKKK